MDYYNKKSKKAFVLTETIIILAVMILFIGTLVSALISGLSYWRDGRLRLKAQESLREGLDTLTNELRQAIPNPDPGTGGNPPTGYLKVDPNIDPTGLIFPNIHNRQGNYIEFTEPFESNYNPVSSGWTPENPANYQTVRYHVQDGVLKRHVTRYSNSGAIVSQSDDNVVSLTDGSIEIKTVFLSPTFVEVEMTASISKFSYTIKTKVKIGT